MNKKELFNYIKDFVSLQDDSERDDRYASNKEVAISIMNEFLDYLGIKEQIVEDPPEIIKRKRTKFNDDIDDLIRN